MRCAKVSIESLERRQLLDGAVEVWAGNTDLRTMSNPSDRFINIDQQGYTKIGETNSANASVTLGGAGNYKYFVLVTRGRVQVDSVRTSAGSYLSSINDSVNTASTSNILGASNNTYAIIGTGTTSGAYAGAMLLVSPTTWSGLTVKTGTIEPVFQLTTNSRAEYIQGASTPFAYKGSLEVWDHGLITSARVHTPAGRFFTLSADSEGDNPVHSELFAESDYVSKAKLDGEFGDGTYTVYLDGPFGSKNYSFSVGAVAFPIQVPSSTTLVHGRTDMPTKLSVGLPSITDTSIGWVQVDVEDASENEVFTQNTGRTGTFPAIQLQGGQSYDAKLEFGTGRNTTDSKGNQFAVGKSNRTEYIFATTGFVQGTPDLQGVSFTAAVATLNPGDTFPLNISVASSGGIVVGNAPAPRPALLHKMGLSLNKTIGDADDVILFYSPEAGATAGWGFSGQMPVRIPDTAAPGRYYVFGSLDANNAVSEANESNNIGWSAQPVITIPPQAITLDPTTHRLSIAGTAGADTIAITGDGQTVRVVMNGATRSFAKADVSSVYASGAGGNDAITASGAVAGLSIYGGDGNDTLYGGSGADVIYGNAGDDRVFGQGGNDSVYAGLGADSIDGGAGDDSLIGGDQSDTIRGSDGNDYIEGKGKNDTLFGGLGNDTIYGGAGNNMIYGDDGNDRIFALNLTGFRDTINGGAGTDAAQRDSNDVLSSVEQNIL